MAGLGSEVRRVAALREQADNPPPPADIPQEPTLDEQAADARRRSLLSRDRGFLSTVKTSFRGLLGLAEPTTQRKTLLGE